MSAARRSARLTVRTRHPPASELVHGRSWPTRRELICEVFEYIEAFYNPLRGHSTLGYLSPVELENSTLSADGASLAASRLASPNENIN